MLGWWTIGGRSEAVQSVGMLPHSMARKSTRARDSIGGAHRALQSEDRWMEVAGTGEKRQCLQREAAKGCEVALWIVVLSWCCCRAGHGAEVQVRRAVRRAGAREQARSSHRRSGGRSVGREAGWTRGGGGLVCVARSRWCGVGCEAGRRRAPRASPLWRLARVRAAEGRVAHLVARRWVAGRAEQRARRGTGRQPSKR